MRTALVFVVCLLSGCVAPVQATRELPQPQTLTEVNAMLDGQRVTIGLMGGSRIPGVTQVVVSYHDVRFERDGSRQAVPVEAVQHITPTPGGGAGVGVLGGLAYGAVGMALGGLVIATSEPGGYGQTVGLLVLVGGAIAAIPAAIVGGMLGQRRATDRSVPLYQAPLERYMAAPSAE